MSINLDLEVIQQWLDWLDEGDEDALREDFMEILNHPERCQPPNPIRRINGNPEA